ncbi:MAG TPA: DUF3822 family protein [Parapedobacter sp.]|nr:DUF3822 family protein [Parapedobacter sp.]
MIYTTTDIDGQQTTDYTLLMGVGTETHQLVVIDQARQLKFAASYDPANVDPEVVQLLDRGFATVKLGIADSRYTFIPADVYDEQQHDTYLQYLPFDGVGATHISDIPQLGIKLLHQTSRIGLEELADRFIHAGNYPRVQGLLGAAAGQGMQTNEPLLVIDRHGPWVTISLFDAGRFLYCHDFESANEDDFTYHLLAVVNQFGLADRQPAIHLAGNIDYEDHYYKRAATYGGNVALADSGIMTGIRLPDEMVPHQHRFLSLLGLYPCES